jgi:NAD(P)-dependent dehydrogenase (short-subunit alcohol dehydrogenase family)
MKSVLVTGASTGIGEACARRLDKLGWTVYAGVRKEADGERLRSGASERLTPVILDVTDAAQIAAAAKLVGDAVGSDGLQGLVNNAGIGVGGPLEFLPIEELRRVFEVNTIGAVAVTQAFLPLLRPARGRIVMMSSLSGKVSGPLFGPYAASKHALEALSDSLRIELAEWGIHIAVVEPGAVSTPIWDKGRVYAAEQLDRLPDEAKKLYAKPLSMVDEAINRENNRGIDPDIVAKTVAHALNSSRPRTRYPVGLDAQVATRFLPLVPDKIRDRIIRRRAGA